MADELQDYLVSKRDLSQFFGVSTTTVDTWVMKGCPIKERSDNGNIKLMSLPEVARWKIFQSGESSELENERTRLTKWQADKTELEVAVLRGELIPSEIVQKVWGGMVMSFRSRVMSIPTKSAHSVLGAINVAEAESVLKKLVNEALEELADYDPKAYGLSNSEDGSEDGSAAADNDGEPVGRRKQKAKPRGKRGAGSLEH